MDFQVPTCNQGVGGIQNDDSELWLHTGITGELSKVPTASSSEFGSWGEGRLAWYFSKFPYDSHVKSQLRTTDVEELEPQSLASRALEVKVSLALVPPNTGLSLVFSHAISSVLGPGHRL